ncbi:hypothetical protein [Streptomyces sp. NPDC057966]|uniref:hypothetical protein n=1 Tax=Streptomyces sp. NPDC057966 TaxID=3346292 RepID=UPI0036E7B95C
MTQHLTVADYSPADLSEIRILMNRAVGEWQRLLKEHSSNGMWQPAPSDSDVLHQLTEADRLLAAMSRTALAARTGIRDIDSRARRHFLERVPKQPV